MLPSEDFSIESPLSPDELLLKIQADAEDWREARLSEPARSAGMYGFAFTPNGRAFRLRARMSTRGHFVPVYDGTVLPLETGSRIDGAFRVGRPTLAALMLWLCVGAFMFVLTIGQMALSVGMAAAAFALAASLGLVGVCALWVAFIVRYAWARRGLARDETKALLLRASSAIGPEPTSRLTGRLSGPA
jgi:hypothetical protein